jgi:hypothetical protein
MKPGEHRRWSLLVLLAWSAACGEAPVAPAAPGPSGAAGSSVSQADGGEAGEAAVPGAGGGDSSGGGDVSVEIVTVPAAEQCVPATATPTVFMPPEELGLVFDRAGVVGERRYAFDSASLALVTFGDEEGTDSSAMSYGDLIAVAVSGEDLQTLELGDGGELLARAYDGFLVQRDDELRLEEGASQAHALAASDRTLLAVWNSDGELRGSSFSPGGVLGDSFDFGPRSCGDHGCVPRIAWTGERFVVLWMRVEPGGKSVLAWAALSQEGAILATRNVFAAEDHYGLVDAAPLADGRLAILLTLGAPALAPILLFVDEHGVPEPVLQRLEGATEAWSIARSGGGLALVARSTQSQAVLRSFDGAGKVAREWTCLDDSGVDTAFEPRAALFAEGAALGAVVRLTDGSAAYLADLR